MTLQRKPSGLIKLSSLTLAALFAAQGGCGEERVRAIDNAQELVEEMQRPRAPIECASTEVLACAGQLDDFFGFGFDCDTQDLVVLLTNSPAPGSPLVSCQDVYDACDAYAAAHPGANIACRFGLGWIYRRELSPGACEVPTVRDGGCADPCAVGDSQVENRCVGPGTGSTSDTIFVEPSGESTCYSAHEHCWFDGILNPLRSVECRFDGQLYHHRQGTLPYCQ